MERHSVNKWIVAGPPKPDAGIRLFAFSHAGGGAATYRPWVTAAPPSLEVLPIQLPGRETRFGEPALNSFQDVVTSILNAIEPWLDRPFAFFGHSLGSVVAFEISRSLRRAGQRLPEALFVSANRAPQLPWLHPPVRDLSDLDLLQEVHRRYGSIPDVILQNPEMRELLTPALRADMTLVETYRYEPEPPFAFPIMAYGGDKDHLVTLEMIDAWQSQTTGAFRRRLLSGGHLFLQECWRDLLADISGALDTQN